MTYIIEKSISGTQYWVVRLYPSYEKEYLRAFDDEVKATAYKERMERGETKRT